MSRPRVPSAGSTSSAGFNLKPPIPLPHALRTVYFGVLVLWIVTSAFQFGYHISALNSLQAVIACQETWLKPDEGPGSFALPPCIPMSEAQFGFLTSIYTIGGFLGSVYASRLADSRGRRTAVRYAAGCVGVGGILMSVAATLFTLVIGRFIVGLGCGMSTVLVPMYLAEIAPVHIRGSIGVLNQLGIVTGILTAQSLAIIFARPTGWRTVPFISACIALLQLLVSIAAVESPKWTQQQSSHAVFRDQYSQVETEPDDFNADLPAARAAPVDEENVGGGGASDASSGSRPRSDQLTITQAWNSTDPLVRQGLKVVAITQLAQQLSGINAVLYYSTSIMAAVMPTEAKYVALIVTLVNVPLTFVPIFLIDRLGRRPLLLSSIICMLISALTLSVSINSSSATISSTAIIAFVASFSFGLGPIPFVLVNEVVPPHATSASSSIGLGLNWLANFVVGIAFLPVRNALRGDGGGDGNVFFVFTIILGTAAWLVVTNYKG